MVKLGYKEVGMVKVGPEQGNCIGLFGVAVNRRWRY